jgi:hypothetical protein
LALASSAPGRLGDNLGFPPSAPSPPSPRLAATRGGWWAKPGSSSVKVAARICHPTALVGAFRKLRRQPREVRRRRIGRLVASAYGCRPPRLQGQRGGGGWRSWRGGCSGVLLVRSEGQPPFPPFALSPAQIRSLVSLGCWLWWRWGAGVVSSGPGEIPGRLA